MFTLSNAFSYNSLNRYTDETEITLYSDAYTRLLISLRLFRVNDVWYAGGSSDSALFKVSDAFLDMVNVGTER